MPKKKKKYSELQSAPEAFFYQLFEKLDWIDIYNIKSQYIIPELDYRVDFFFEKLDLVIEIDSDIHKKTKFQDLIRDSNLRRKGYYVYRIDWTEFKKNPQKIIEDLVYFIKKIKRLKPYEIKGKRK